MSLSQLSSRHENFPRVTSVSSASPITWQPTQQADHAVASTKPFTSLNSSTAQPATAGTTFATGQCNDQQSCKSPSIAREKTFAARSISNAEHERELKCSPPSSFEVGGKLQSSQPSRKFEDGLQPAGVSTKEHAFISELSDIEQSVWTDRLPGYDEQSQSNKGNLMDGKSPFKEIKSITRSGQSPDKLGTSIIPGGNREWKSFQAVTSSGPHSRTKLQQIQSSGSTKTKTTFGATSNGHSNESGEDSETSIVGECSSAGSATVSSSPRLPSKQSEFKTFPRQRSEFSKDTVGAPTAITGQQCSSFSRERESFPTICAEGSLNGSEGSTRTSFPHKGSPPSRIENSLRSGSEGSKSPIIQRSRENVKDTTTLVSKGDFPISREFISGLTKIPVTRIIQGEGDIESPFSGTERSFSRIKQGLPSGHNEAGEEGSSSNDRLSETIIDEPFTECIKGSFSRINSQELGEKSPRGNIERFSSRRDVSPATVIDGSTALFKDTSAGKIEYPTPITDGEVSQFKQRSSSATTTGPPRTSNDGTATATTAGPSSAIRNECTSKNSVGVSLPATNGSFPGQNEPTSTINGVPSTTAGTTSASSPGAPTTANDGSTPSGFIGSPRSIKNGSKFGSGSSSDDGGSASWTRTDGSPEQIYVEQTQLASIRKGEASIGEGETSSTRAPDNAGQWQTSSSTGGSHTASHDGSTNVPTAAAASDTYRRTVGERGRQEEQRRGGTLGWEEGEVVGPIQGEAAPTTEAAKGILAIDKTDVHRICSGQVVVSLATAVKELVENSLDAGSSSVEVRLTGYGAASIVVVDDGPGVPPADFHALALKHHTSKLRDFGELCGVATFGFRGEALSSLCALSKLTICTRHHSQPVATMLTYDSDGVLVQQKSVPRQVGTTVSVSGLFSSLPVRRKEFERNLKKDYNKLLQVLHSYAIISTNVRLQVSNQTDSSSRRHTVLATNSYPSLRENVTAIYGTKQASSLLPLEHQVNGTVDQESTGDKTTRNDDAAFQLVGLVSSCAHGAGRSAPDRQFYYINNRPCDPVKVSRMLNEVYHSYNRHQYPLVVLNIITSRNSVDVNLTPDKRQVMMHHENVLLATIKSTLQRLYEDIPTNTVGVNAKLTCTPKTLQPSLRSLLPSTQILAPSSRQAKPGSQAILASAHAKYTSVQNMGSLSPSPQEISSTLDTYHETSAADDVGLHASVVVRTDSCTPTNYKHFTQGTKQVSTLYDTAKTARTVSQNSDTSLSLQQKTPASPATHDMTSEFQMSSPTQNKLSLSSRLAQFTSPSIHVANNIGRMISSSNNNNTTTGQNCSKSLIHNSHKTANNQNNNSNNCCLKRAVDADDDQQSPKKKHPRLHLTDENENSYEGLNSVNLNKKVLGLLDPAYSFNERDASIEADLSLSMDHGDSAVNLDTEEGEQRNHAGAAPAVISHAGACPDLDQDSSCGRPVSEEVCGEMADNVDEGKHGAVKSVSANASILQRSGSKKSIKAHTATDQFLHRLTAKRLQSSDGGGKFSVDVDSNVRKSLQKFLLNSGGSETVKVEEASSGFDADSSHDVEIVFDGEVKNKLIHQNDLHNELEQEDLQAHDLENEVFIQYDDQQAASRSPAHNKNTKVVDICMSKIREKLDKHRETLEQNDLKIVNNFRAKIVPTDNRAAEDELNKVLCKDMFAKMKILGQFNLGFIITQLKSDLFIIDQHATDEKYNFETLQRTCILRHQPLICPQLLHLTPGNETILLDNIDIFTANGFQFDIDESKSFGERVHLKSAPQNRNWSFGKDDIEELIFMLSDSPGEMCRPSRVRDMFASRACRKSVMVGSALSAATMKQLVVHMGEIEQPWNCPHGRPTVRHLVNLDLITKNVLI
uniref:Mismatch repair endonuclease PMS2-like isoform X1 n=2 Tax=Hirondellea gigas TaxID=1518452 RepID=A0A6A7FQA3_9CRUS